MIDRKTKGNFLRQWCHAKGGRKVCAEPSNEKNWLEEKKTVYKGSFPFSSISLANWMSAFCSFNSVFGRLLSLLRFTYMYLTLWSEFSIDTVSSFSVSLVLRKSVEHYFSMLLPGYRFATRVALWLDKPKKTGTPAFTDRNIKNWICWISKFCYT